MADNLDDFFDKAVKNIIDKMDDVSLSKYILPKQSNDCIHNARVRSTKGFYCRDCEEFFNKDSPTYRSGELLSSIWMVLHNINAARGRGNLEYFEDVTQLKEEIGLGKKHDNYEELISKAEVIMRKYGKNSDSARVILK